jgi:GH15 family glucan-1,4-alpha-glucosidase
MLHASRRTRPRLNVVYDVLGGSGLTERDRPELPGYRGARPVRVGNAAAEQFQLDAYAWMIDAGSAFLRATGELYAETWRSLRGHADVLAERWSEPDSGIWEVRGQPHHYVHSKLMAWLGLDRALGIGDRLGVRPRRRARWEAARGRIEQEVVRRGFDEALGSYVRSYGSSELDAATLAVAYGGLEDAGSPRVLGTIRAVRERLGAGGPLLYRFGPGAEGAFVPCSFWLSRALAATGSVDGARESFERTCALATDLGLFAEEIDPTTHEHVGNFPQAFCHAALVEAAAELGRAEMVRASGTLRGSLRT